MLFATFDLNNLSSNYPRVIVDSKLLGPFGALVTSDFLIALGAVYAAAALRFGGDAHVISSSVGVLWYRALIFAAMTVIALFCFGMLRTKHRDRFLRTIVNAISSVALATAMTILITYAIPQAYLGRGILALAAVFTVAGVIMLRFFFNRIVDESYFKRKILILGAGSAAATIENGMRRRTDRQSFVVVGYVPIGAGSSEIESQLTVQIEPGNIAAFASDNGIDEIVVAVDERRHNLPIWELLSLRLSGIRVTDIVSFWEQESGRLKIDVLKPSSLVFGDGFICSAFSLAKKRVLDIFITSIFIVIASPIMLLVSLAIWLEAGCKNSVLYRQVRVGYRGVPFQMLKFRSMEVNAEADGQARWAVNNDPRVTRVGRVIRAARLDELPQLFNIAIGQMSFVGPRPERPEFVNELNKVIPYYDERHLTKPGITGWAQLTYPYGASVEDAREKLQLDLYYLKHHSLLFDLMIIMRTVEVVFTGNGAR
jgi:sugar transferase (PEP-CTERM system associated)